MEIDLGDTEKNTAVITCSFFYCYAVILFSEVVSSWRFSDDIKMTAQIHINVWRHA